MPVHGLVRLLRRLLLAADSVGLVLAFGVACALVERQTSGRGQVIDAAMVDGAALLAELQIHGANPIAQADAVTEAAEVDGSVPENVLAKVQALPLVKQAKVLTF